MTTTKHPDATVQAIREALARPSQCDRQRERDAVDTRARVLDALEPKGGTR